MDNILLSNIEFERDVIIYGVDIKHEQEAIQVSLSYPREKPPLQR